MKNKLLFTTALVAAALTASVSYADENKVYEGNYSSSETRVTDAAGKFTIENVTASGVFQEGQDYVRNGIFGTRDDQGYNQGEATFTGTANITNGGGIEVGNVTVSEGAVINISGQNDLLPGTIEDDRKDYHKGSILAGYKGIAINGGTINLSDGGMLIAGTKEGTADFLVNSGTINVDNSFLVADNDGTIKFNGADAITAAEEAAQGDFVESLNKISASDLNDVADTLGDHYGNEDNVVQAKIDAYVDSIKTQLGDEPSGNDVVNEFKDALGDKAPESLSDVNDDAALKAWLEENKLTKDDFEKDETYKTQTGDKVDNALVDAYNNDASGEKLTLTWDDLHKDAQKKAEAQIDAAKNAATPTINLTGNNRLVGAVDMEASVMNLKNGTTTADGAVTLGQNAVANIDGTLKAEQGTQLNDGAVVNLTGTMDSNVTVAQNANVNVNGSEAFIQNLAGDGTLNINANTSVSTLFGSASEIGTLAVKEGSTFILDSLDKVSADPDNDIEAKDAVNLTASTMEVSGTAIVADNGNSIAATTVKDGGILDLGYNTFSSNVTMDAGSTLNVGVKNDDEAPAGELIHGNIDGDLNVTASSNGEANASMNLIIAADTKLGEESKIDLASGSENGLGNLVVNNNLLYNLDGVDDDGKITGSEITVSKKDSSEVAAGVAANGANGNQAGTIAAFVDGLSGNAQADNITNQISTLVQSRNVKEAARLAKEVAPVAAPVAQSQVTETTNQVFGAVATRLSGGSVSSAAEGKSSGDSVFERAAMWVQGLFNKSKYDGSNDFKTDSTGLALGAEKYLNSDVKVGAGYAYTNSDVKQGDRKIDVDTHTAFVYGEYKPSDWYVNGIASYNWGDYDEKKYGGLSGKYDVNSIALQAMTGYDFHMNGAVVTPEAGLRYINIHQDSYTDTAGQRVSENSSDYLTGIVGAKIKKDYTLSNGMNIRPEARLAMTYDLVNDNSNASVMLANGSAYQVRGEALDRFGVEAGVGLTAEVDDNVEVSLGYEGKFRDHYKDHTGLLNAKYKF